jgi:hypothetical protein
MANKFKIKRSLKAFISDAEFPLHKIKKKTPAFLHGVFRRGENAPVARSFKFTYLILYHTQVENQLPSP